MLEDFKNANGEWVKFVSVNRSPIWTKSGQVWRAMRDRCKEGGAKQVHYARYVGCAMHPNFQDFNSFTEWALKQVGYGLDNYDLDKDLLLPGNKIYGPETCCFIPETLNCFLLACNASRGEYPLGVHKQGNKFKSQISILGKKIMLGTYQTPELAFEAYKIAKYAERDRWVQRLEAGEFVVDQRVIDALKVWEIRE